MPISFGSASVTALYLGTTSIVSAYLGATQVFGGSFTPLDLFSTGSQGIWLDPSDLSTMFSDRAGTTPVTAPGTVVGLRLDKSKGGEQSLPTTGWAKNSGDGVVTVTDNVITITGATTTTRVDLTSPVWQTGDYIKMTMNASIGSATGVFMFFGGSSLIIISGVGSYAGISTGLTRIQIASGSATFTITARSRIPGNHAVAPTDAARPTYGVEPKGGRRNLLTYSEAFSESVWAKTNATVTENTGTAPDGTTTADKLVETAVTGRHIITSSSFTFVAGVDYAYTIRVKAAERQYVQVSSSSQATSSFANFDVSAGTKTAGTTGFGSIAPDANGFYEITIQFTAAGGSGTISVDALTNPTAGRGLGSYTGDGTSGILIWGAQLELGPTATNYQRVLSAYDITESGVATTHYVQYDGSDDSMSTAAIDFTATDKMSVFAGVRKLGSSIGLIAELSANADSNIGVFSLASDALAASQYFTKAVGNPAGGGYQSTASPYASPHSAVIASTLDIAGSTLADKVTLRVNATASTSRILSSAGTGNFGNYPVFFGRRGNSSLSFSGKDYGLIVVGKAASAGEITDTETWLAAKTSGVTI